MPYITLIDSRRHLKPGPIGILGLGAPSYLEMLLLLGLEGYIEERKAEVKTI